MGILRLGVNIDHIATLRQARYATMPDSKNAEPDPIVAASICERAGAHGITAHLRADRRHIQDRDMERLRANIMTKLNFEMGNTPEIPNCTPANWRTRSQKKSKRRSWIACVNVRGMRTIQNFRSMPAMVSIIETSRSFTGFRIWPSSTSGTPLFRGQFL